MAHSIDTEMSSAQTNGSVRKRARKRPKDSSDSTEDAEPSVVMVDAYSVFMCKECNFILAEGRSASEFNKKLDVIACLKATRNVKFDTEVNHLETDDCFYSALKCKMCSTKVGIFLVGAGAEFAHLREMFCFCRTAIVYYSMKTKQLIEGSRINVEVSQCVTLLDELEHEVLETCKRLTDLTKAVVGSPLSFSDED